MKLKAQSYDIEVGRYEIIINTLDAAGLACTWWEAYVRLHSD